MKPTSTFFAALLCVVLVGPVSGAGVAFAASDKPATAFPEELKVTMYNDKNMDPDELVQDIDDFCLMILNGDLDDLDRFFKKPNFVGKELEIFTRTNCGERSPIRTAFKSENIRKFTVWEHIVEVYGKSVLNGPDPVDQLNVLDYLVEQKMFLELKKAPSSVEKSFLKTIEKYIPVVKSMGAVHSKFYLWEQGKASP